MIRSSVYWLTQTLQDVPQDNDWLGPGEIARLQQMKFPKRRSDWTLGRWTGKRALGSYLSLGGRTVQPRALEISTASDGAPEALLEGRIHACSVSISHSAGIALAVVAADGVALGCDVELVESRPENFFDDYFTDAENRFLRSSAPADRALQSTLIWGAKECALKCLREGLRRDTRSVEVTINQGNPQEGWSSLSVDCRELGRSFGGWWRSEAGFVLTVAAQPPPSPPHRLHP